MPVEKNPSSTLGTMERELHLSIRSLNINLKDCVEGISACTHLLPHFAAKQKKKPRLLTASKNKE